MDMPLLQLPLLPQPTAGESASTPRTPPPLSAEEEEEGEESKAPGRITPLCLSLSPRLEETTRTEPPPPTVADTTTGSSSTAMALLPLSLPPVPPARFVAGQGCTHHVNPGVIVHGTDWFKNDAATLLPVNGPMIVEHDFAINTPIGNTITCSSNNNGTQSRLVDYFMLIMFPPAELTLITTLTLEELIKDGKKSTTKEEMLKLFGVCILIT
jgi:hypothetical protein